MLLTIDLGNTNLKLGVFDGEKQICFSTYDSKQSDYGAVIKNHLYKNGLKEDMIDDSIISSVIPNVTNILVDVIRDLFMKDPIIIDPNNSYGIRIDTPNINEVGSDLLVMCAYAYYRFKKELLVISMGTVTVISHVSYDGAFRHCIISPGYGEISETLWGKTAKLPKFEIRKTDSFLANTTISAMNVGIYQGYIGSLRYLIAGIKKELTTTPMIVACGGFGKDVVSEIKEIEYYEPDMVTSGLNYIYNTYYKK